MGRSALLQRCSAALPSRLHTPPHPHIPSPHVSPTNENVSREGELPNVGPGGPLVEDARRLARQAVEGGKVGALRGRSEGSGAN